MKHVIRAVCIGAVVLAASCQSNRPHKSEAEPPVAPVTHVVLCWLKTPGDEAARQRLIDASRTFADIPGVVRVTAGRAVPSDRPVVDDSFDVAIVIGFKDVAAMNAYEVHPIHKKAVDEVLRPAVAKVVVYDLVDEARKAPAR